MSDMFSGFLRSLLIVGVVMVGIFIAVAVLPKLAPTLSPAALLDVASGVACLVWLLFVLKVPWDLYFETSAVLFEMHRSTERGLPVKPDRLRYVERMQRVTCAIAVGAHVVSATFITTLTFLAGGKIGYYFALFYVVATFFRPTTRAYLYLRQKLLEIRQEVTHPRDDVLTLREELKSALAKIKSLEVELTSLTKGVKEQVKRIDGQLLSAQVADQEMNAQVADLHSGLVRAERSFADRIHTLSEQVEHSMMKAFDNQDIVSGLRSFIKLIKQA